MNEEKIIELLENLTAKVESLEKLVREKCNGVTPTVQSQKIKSLDMQYGLFAILPECDKPVGPLTFDGDQLVVSTYPEFIKKAFNRNQIQFENQEIEMDEKDPNIKFVIKELTPHLWNGQYAAVFLNNDIYDIIDGDMFFSAVFETEDNSHKLWEINVDENDATGGTDVFEEKEISFTQGKDVFVYDNKEGWIKVEDEK